MSCGKEESPAGFSLRSAVEHMVPHGAEIDRMERKTEGMEQDDEQMNSFQHTVYLMSTLFSF